MIQRFRQWLRGWLGIAGVVDFSSAMNLRLTDLEQQLAYERQWRAELTEALRKQIPRKQTPRYTDYESSQKAVLSEFEGE